MHFSHLTQADSCRHPLLPLVKPAVADMSPAAMLTLSILQRSCLASESITLTRQLFQIKAVETQRAGSSCTYLDLHTDKGMANMQGTLQPPQGHSAAEEQDVDDAELIRQENERLRKVSNT